MTNFDRRLARRTVIRSAGLGLVAGALADASFTQTARAEIPGSEIWSGEYWAKKGDIPLWLYRKRIGAPKGILPSQLPVVFFVHGSSVSSRAFDLNVAGHGDYSIMNAFARAGFHGPNKAPAFDDVIAQSAFWLEAEPVSDGKRALRKRLARAYGVADKWRATFSEDQRRAADYLLVTKYGFPAYMAGAFSSAQPGA